MLIGNPNVAEAKYRSALRHNTASLGPAHPTIAGSLNNLGVLLRVQNRFQEAVVHHRDALSVFTKIGEPNIEMSCSAASGVGDIYDDPVVTFTMEAMPKPREECSYAEAR